MNRTVTRLLALMLLLCPFTLLAQKDVITVTGTVVDSSDEPLIGVSVLVKGTSNGISTNIDGEFTLKASVGDVLTFSYVGFKPQEATVSGTAPMHIVLQEDSQVLEEVVVTAMGIRRKEASLTYATQEVKGEELMRVQDANFVNALNGKVAGVTIQQSAGGAGGASKILLRGNKSVMGNNAPLIVVDGIPMTNQVGGAAGGQWQADAYDMTYAGTSESGDALSLINPDDIESINVLKGANAAALYGSAAANGVLMITTKKGKQGTISVSVNSNVTFEKPLMTPELQRVYGASIVGTTLSKDSWGKKLSDMTAEDLAFEGAHLTNRATNQVDDFFGTGTTWNNSVSVSGGTEKITSFFSFSNSNSDGMVPGNTYNRNTFSFRQGYNLFNDRLHIDVALNYVYAKTVNRPGGGTVMNPLYDLYIMAPNIDMNYYRNNYRIEEGQWESNNIGFYNQSGQYISGTNMLGTKFGDDGKAIDPQPMQNWAYRLTAGANNPYWTAKQNRSNRVDERIYGYVTANFEIIPGLNIQGRLNMDRARQEAYSKRYATTANPADFERYGIYNQDKFVSTDIYVDALLTYNKTFKEDWDVSATAGWSGHTVRGTSQNIYGNATYLSSSMDALPTLVNCFEPTIQWLGSPTSYSKSSNWDKGLFFTGQLGWKEMVFVEGSYRQDWYRAFKQFSDQGTPTNYGYYSFGVNTLVHKYLKLPEVITYLKVRASYSEVGNSIPNVLYSLGSYNMSTGAFTGTGYGVFDNPRPEKSKSFEAGYDISFFNSNLMWDLTYYHTDLTNSYFLASASGSKQKPVNTGLIRNQGIETTLTYNHIFSQDWTWRTAVNFAYNHNRIKKTYKNDQGQSMKMEQSVAEGHVLVRYEEGGSYGDMYAMDLRRNDDGSIWLSPKTGKPQLSSTNYVYLGNMNSKYNLSWSNTIRWKDLSLYFLISGRIGGKTISVTESYLDNLGVSKRSADARLNAERNNIEWISPRTGQSKPGMYVEGTIVPIQDYYQTVGGQFYAPDYCYDATNFRMSEISLGYTLRNLFHGFIKSLNVSVVGRNLFFLYKDSPVDPDISLSTKNGLGAFDVFNMPSVRSFGVNLKLEF